MRLPTVDAGESVGEIHEFDLRPTYDSQRGVQVFVQLLIVVGGFSGEGFVYTQGLVAFSGGPTIMGQGFVAGAAWAAFGVVTVSGLLVVAITGPFARQPTKLVVNAAGFRAVLESVAIKKLCWTSIEREISVIEFHKGPGRRSTAVSSITLSPITYIIVPDEACQSVVGSARAAGLKVREETFGSFPDGSPRGIHYTLSPQ